MSIDYYILVPAGKWPSVEQLKSALTQDGNPVELAKDDGIANSAAFGFAPNRNVLDVNCDGVRVGLGAQIEILGDEDFALLENTWEPEFANPIVSIFKTLDLPINQGDYLIQIYIETSPFDWGPWWLLASTFVKHFDASFYDPQSDELWDVEALIINGHQFRGELNAYRSQYRSI